jgi:glycosyltransferase involved in cell wall biosynthesis
VSRFSYNHCNKRVIVQNQDDYSIVVKAGLAKEREVEMIPGSGVDLDEYAPLTGENRKNVVLLPARLLRDKGIIEFLEAAELLKHKHASWEFVIAGAGDYRNPSTVPKSLISDFESRGTIKWLGYVDDMLPLYAKAKIVCLPSYREGMPKCLLEAAAAGCAVITTDVPGCRCAILPGDSGDLVPPRDTVSLALSLERLMTDPQRIIKYGEMGRKLAKERFGLHSVVSRNLAIYDELMNGVP